MHWKTTNWQVFRLATWSRNDLVEDEHALSAFHCLLTSFWRDKKVPHTRNNTFQLNWAPLISPGAHVIADSNNTWRYIYYPTSLCTETNGYPCFEANFLHLNPSFDITDPILWQAFQWARELCCVSPSASNFSRDKVITIKWIHWELGDPDRDDPELARIEKENSEMAKEERESLEKQRAEISPRYVDALRAQNEGLRIQFEGLKAKNEGLGEEIAAMYDSQDLYAALDAALATCLKRQVVVLERANAAR